MFGNKSYVKIWKLEDKGKYFVAQMSSSRKLEDGKYETDWKDGLTRLVGTAANQVRNGLVKEGSNVQIESCGVTNNYDKEKKTTYTNYVVFAFADQSNTNKTKTKAQNHDAKASNDIEEDLPFA